MGIIKGQKIEEKKKITIEGRKHSKNKYEV